MDGKIGQSAILYQVPNIPTERVLLIGCGKERELNEAGFKKMITTLTSVLQNTGITDAVSQLTDLHIKTRDLHWHIRTTIETLNYANYRFDAFKSQKDTVSRPFKKLTFYCPKRPDLEVAQNAIREGNAISEGIKITRDLGNMPANVCTPEYLAQEAKSLAQVSDMLVDVLDQDEMETLGMGSLLSVAQGSRKAPKLIVMHYRKGKDSDQPIVLVGKGVTFDSGGISLKPSANMDEMKYDMCGAATVLGVMTAINALNLPINLTAIIPAVENKPDGQATNPGDVVTSLSGQTIEVLNTDAEGRLILCDALTYAERFKPEIVIDIATLTGACLVALGNHASGLLGNQPSLVNDLLTAGKNADDRAWELPLWDDYQQQIKSPVADIANIGGRWAGTITAACFLSRFTKKFHWAHLDIAGTAWVSGEKRTATGRPVPLLTQYLLNRVKNAEAE